jgi:hypothetical protein
MAQRLEILPPAALCAVLWANITHTFHEERSIFVNINGIELQDQDWRHSCWLKFVVAFCE